MGFTGVISANSRTANLSSGVRYVGIQSMEQTVVSEEDGGINVLTITLTNGDVQNFEVRNGSMPMVESAARYSMDLSGMDVEWDQRRMCGIVGLEFFSKTGRSCDAFRISSVGVKTEGAGPVRFVLYEVVQNGDGETCTLKPSAILGEVVMETDGIARLDFEKGFYIDLETSVIMAVSDRAMLLGYKAGGIVMQNWPIVEETDYYTDGSTSDITCSFGEKENPVWLAYRLDFSTVNYVTIEEFARTHSERLTQAERDIDNLEAREEIPTTFIVPKGYVLTYNGEEIVWAAPTGSSVEVDATLTLSGKAADSKAVGDRLSLVERGIADILYDPISITSFGHNTGVKERGDTVTSVNLTWAINKTPVSLTLDGVSIDVNARSMKVDGLNITYGNGKRWTLVATDERGTVDDRNTAGFSFLNCVYYGMAELPAAYDSEFIKALATKTDPTSTRKRTIILTGDGTYVWYCLPVELGKCAFTSAGFPAGIELVNTIPFTNALGYMENYYVYRSNQRITDTVTIEVS